MTTPYEDLPARAFWKTAVTGQDPAALRDLYRPKFAITKNDPIATAGSCFAQHIARHLKARGFRVVDAERAPRGLGGNAAHRFGYDLYSARYGNIYTARQLRQLAEEALGKRHPDFIWEKDGRFYDALRPSVEPEGLLAAETVKKHRAYHLGRVRHVLENARTFIFTLGLTEAWVHSESGTVYPTAPGVIAGEFDVSRYQFRNFTFQETYDDLAAFFLLSQRLNPSMNFILTVSPVPLTATASDEHVLSATTYSKSVLRAVSGQLMQEWQDVDYVPSYEVITSGLSAGQFFEENQRSIRMEGVDAVMRMFFAEQDGGQEYAEPFAEAIANPASAGDEDLVCEEAMLEAFAE